MSLAFSRLLRWLSMAAVALAAPGAVPSTNAGQILAVDIDSDSLVRIDPEQRQVHEVGRRGQLGENGFPAVFALAFDARTDTLYASDVAIDQLLALDPENASGKPIGATQINKLEALAFDPRTRTLYGIDQEADSLIKLDPTDGSPKALVGKPGSLAESGFTYIRSMAIDPKTGVIYGADTDTEKLVTIDPETGKASAVGPLGLGNVSAIAIDPDTGVLYGVDNGVDSLLIIDKDTGKAQEVGKRGWLADEGATRIEGFVILPDRDED